MRARELAVGRVPCLALRVTYVGELGWELYCPAEFGARALGHDLGGGARARARRGRLQGDRLAAAREGLPRVGRGHHARGHALRGGARLRREARQGRLRRPGRARRPREPERAASLPRRSTTRARSRSAPSRCASETTLVGRVTSGGYGYTVETSIAYAYLPAEHDVGTEVEVEIFGEWVAGVVAEEPLFDPDGRADPRMTDLAGRGRARLAGPRARFEVLGGGITNHNLKVEVDGEQFVLRVAGKDTDLLGIDRARRARGDARRRRRSASGRRSSRSSSPRAGSSRASSRARSRRSSGCASRRCSHASLRRCARSTTARAIPGASTPSASSRPTARRRSTRGGDVPGRVRVGARDRAARSRRDGAGAAPVPVPQRPPERELPRRRRAAAHRRLGVRGDGRSLLRPRELLDQPRARRRRERGAARGLLRRASEPTDIAALELMRFMSDFREAMWGVVQSAVSELDFDFDALRDRALRAARADGRRAGVPRSARGLNVRGAPRGAPR